MIAHKYIRGAPAPAEGKGRAIIIALAVVGSAAVVGLLALEQLRLAITIVVSVVLFTLAMVNIRAAIAATFIYLTILGDLRRILVPIVGWSGSDPLLMVGTGTVIFLTAYTITSGSIKIDTPLAKWILVLSVVMILSIFNPRQGGLAVGVAGALLLFVPTLWFWVGRTFATQSFMEVLFYRVIPTLALLAILMGAYQHFYGYLPYQLDWYRIGGYKALGDSEETLRPLSIFANISEYLMYLTVAFALMWAAIIKQRYAAVLLAIPLFISIVLAGSRGPLVISCFVMVFLWAVQGKTVQAWVPRLTLALFIGVIGFTWSLSQVSEMDLGGSQTQAAIERQAALLEPGGGTAGHHSNLFVSGIKSGFTHPLGQGIGFTTLAAEKFGEGGYTTEVDISDMFLTAGIVGGVIYLIVVGWGGLLALRYWLRARSILSLAIVGLLIVCGLGWLKWGHYATTPLIWFVLGALDRFYKELPEDSSA